MQIKQNNIEGLMFRLLKMALHQESLCEMVWPSYSDEDWKECYRLASRHGVMAVAWDGIQMLPAELQPSRPIKLSWAVAVKDYEERYERYCRTAAELSEFYAGHGIAMVQLKGVGLSSYYPVPSHREGGDIDIYTYSADPSRMTDKDANNLADDLIKEMGIDVKDENHKHSNFIFKNISIENHKTFLDIDINTTAVPMNDLLLKLMDPHETLLCDGKYKIMTPSARFNALFLSFHAGQHYCSGLRVHHLFDWACMLKKHGLQLSDEITDKKLLGFIYALTDICNELLGTSVEVTADKKFSKEVYTQLMHPLFSGEPPKNKILIFFYKGARLFYSNYKQSKIFSKPLLKVLWNSIVFHIRRPDTIFT